jgi:hypothetical protein
MEVGYVLYGVKEFFGLVFSHLARWEKDGTFSQGAWVRLYIIPLHAWNEEFFKLCVLDCGNFLCADSFTIDKVKLDYAIVLIATSAMEVIKGEAERQIDDVLVKIKVMEDWGYTLGEDSCLLKDRRASKPSYSNNEEEHGDHEASNNIDMSVDKIVEDMGDGDNPARLRKSRMILSTR